MCRSRRELSNEYLLAKIGVDTAENEPLEVWGKIFRILHWCPYCKGFVWLDSENGVASYWSQAGKQIELSTMGKWWAAVPRETWPKAPYSANQCNELEEMRVL